MLFYIILPNFVQIGSPTADIWRHIHFSKWRPRPLNTTSGFVFVDVTAFQGQSLSANQISSRYLHWRPWYNYFRFRSRPVHRNLHVILHQATEFRPNRSTHYRKMTSHPFLNMVAATAKYYFRFLIFWRHCLQKVKVYQQTKFCPDISIGGWDITISGFEIQTSAILEFYFQFRYRPSRRNVHVILYQGIEFRPNRSIHGGNMTSYPFLKMAAATAKYYFRFCICWCHCLQKVKFYQQTKFLRDIISICGWDITTSGFEIQTSAILEFYFRFRPRSFRRNRRVILLPAAEFRPNRNIRRWNMTSYRFLKWRPSAMLYLLWGNGGPPTKCLSWSEFRPQITTSSD